MTAFESPLITSSNIYKIINNDRLHNMLSHAYMLVCSDKEYVNILCDYLAKVIMCEKKSACMKCSSCKKIAAGVHADVLVFPKAKKQLSVEESRFISSDSFVKPYEGDKKIYIINDGDRATIQAQNALLKTLEEPVNNVIFLFTVANDQNVLPTIKSRMKVVHEGRPSKEDVVAYLMNCKKEPEEKIRLIVDNSGGSITKSMQLLHNKKSVEMLSLSLDIFGKLKNSSQVLEYSYKVMQFKDNLEEFLDILLIMLRELAVVKESKFGIYNSQNYEKIEEISKDYSTKAIFEISKKVGGALKKLASNCAPVAVVDGVLLDVLEVKYLCQN